MNHDHQEAQRGSVLDLLPIIDEGLSRRRLLDLIQPGGLVCPGCGAEVDQERAVRAKRLGRVACRACGKRFSALAGTAFAHTKMTASRIVLLLALLRLGVQDSMAALILDIEASTVWKWREKLRGGRYNDKFRLNED
ncbi:MAG: hypothetical protein K9K64_09185 [Desulfohalobiaceae bacterium]|nr:hypothetical protein [Desulfohalobiaceae bacterium]